ncbi:triose-phosphate isomerase [Aurantivibrio infirmus]
MRRPLVIGNWKMNGTKSSVAKLIDSTLAHWHGMHQAEVAVCAPYVHLGQVARQLAESNIHFGAQDVSQYEDGAYTGDISAAMLADMFCHFVIVGHSERRQFYSESDELVAKKFAAVLAAKMTPVLCIGESLQQRDGGETLKVVERQLQAVIDRVGIEKMSHAVVAYEPIWAIGTGRTATPQQAEEVHSFIREQLKSSGLTVRILYGGSVKSNNAAELFEQQNIDGGLVGGASLNADDFLDICRAAELPSTVNKINAIDQQKQN